MSSLVRYGALKAFMDAFYMKNTSNWRGDLSCRVTDPENLKADIIGADRVSSGVAIAVTMLFCGWGGAAKAGPPFVSDDPQPTDTRRWEIYNFVSGSHVPGATAGEAGFDLNYGGVTDLQLTATLPLAFETEDRAHVGWGDLELGAKYRFLHQKTAGLDVAVFPRLILPTASRQFGTGRLQVLLPIWAQKDFGPWSVFGGGGYDVNPGPGNLNFWISGLAATRQVTERLVLGAEVYHQTSDAVGGKPYTGMNLGAIYKLIGPWSLLVSGGPGLLNAREGGEYAFYASLKLDY